MPPLARSRTLRWLLAMAIVGPVALLVAGGLWGRHGLEVAAGGAAAAALSAGAVVRERRGVVRDLRARVEEQDAVRQLAAFAASGPTEEELVVYVAAEASRLVGGAPVTVEPADADPPAGAVPIEVGGTPWASLVVGGEAVGAETRARLLRFAEAIGEAVETVEARAVLRLRAATDPLTGLTNHRIFHERLKDEFARARRHKRPISVVVLDLDGFKAVNEADGHLAGDAVLRELGARLRSRLRAGNVLARIGGDEFAVIVPEAEGIEAVAVAERMRRAVAERPFDGRALALSAGVCDGSYAETAPDLLRLADGALYWAKAHGRDRIWLYSPEVASELSAADQVDNHARAQALTGIRALARAIDAKDPSTREHSERVADLSVRIARAAGWNERRVELLEEAALVHDVGKIGVADAVLFKPADLDEREVAAVRVHAMLGAQIASEVLGAEQVVWIRGHHERIDGGGYPDGLRDEEITDGARILTLADAWDAMTSRRPYREPLSTEAALEECRRCAGLQFDAALVDVLASVLGGEARVPEGDDVGQRDVAQDPARKPQ